MRDGELVFNFGFASLIIMAIVTAAFFVAFSSDENNLKKKNKTIVSLEQDLANATVKFSSLVQPEVLRPIVATVYPKYKPIGTGQTISLESMK
jgi:hypothetical protein